MKKIILLIGVFFTFGCTAKYDLIITEDNIEENLLLSSEEFDNVTKDELYGQYLDEYPIYFDEEFLYYAPTEKKDGVTYYEKSIQENMYGYDASYKAIFDLDDYKNSRLLNNAFENYNIGYDRDKKYYFIIAQDLKIFDYNNYLTTLEVNINVNNYEIVESNAYEQVGNNLSWTFTKNNNTDRIILKYKEKEKESEINNNQTNNEENNNTNTNVKDNSNDIIIMFISLITFIIVLTIIIFFKNKKK